MKTKDMRHNTYLRQPSLNHIIYFTDIPPVTYSSKGRRRSSCTPRPDPDEILKNLKAVKGELLGRSMSICSGDWRIRRSKPL